MNTQPPGPPSPSLPPPPPRKSNYKPILITLLVSFLLGGGSCFGFLSTLNMNGDSPANTAFAMGFVICLFVFLGSALGLVSKAIRATFSSRGQ